MSAADKPPYPRQRPISLLLVTSSYLPIVGGSEIEAQRVCSALVKRGHSVTILCPGGPPMPRSFHWTDGCGLPVRIFGSRWPARLRGYAFALGTAWTLLKERGRYDVVYFLMPGLQVAVGVPVAGWLGKPLVMKFSGSNEVRKLENSWVGRLQLAALRRWADRIMVLNAGIRREAVESGLPDERLLWMPNPVDTDEFRPVPAAEKADLRRRLGVTPKSGLLVFVGRLAPEKNLSTLVRAFSRLLQKCGTAELVLVGDGPCRPELERLIESLAIGERVRITGLVDIAAVRSWLQAGDLVLLVSTYEGLPMSLIEGMATGIPCVVSDIPANTQLVEDGRHGFVVDGSDESGIADACLRLLDSSELRARMGQAGRQRVVESYSTAEIAATYEALFAELATASGRQGT